jgi:hypothetical protein
MAKAEIKRHLKGAVLGISRLKAKRNLNLLIYYCFEKFLIFKLGNLFKVLWKLRSLLQGHFFIKWKYLFYLFIYLFPNDAVEANRATLKEP